jgi:hypothetical protein
MRVTQAIIPNYPPRLARTFLDRWDEEIRIWVWEGWFGNNAEKVLVGIEVHRSGEKVVRVCAGKVDLQTRGSSPSRQYKGDG